MAPVSSEGAVILNGTQEVMLKMGLCLQPAPRFGAVGAKNPQGKEAGASKARTISVWTHTSTGSRPAALGAELSGSITETLYTECEDGKPL